MRRVLFIIATVLLLTLCATVIGLSTRPSLHQWSDFRASSSDLAEQDNGIAVTWLGTATVLITDGDTRLLSDGFFSRPSLLDLASGPIEPDQQRIDQALTRYGIDALDAVMVLHSHYDHAMDAPLVARQTGARLLGSASSANVARGLGLAEDQIQVVTPGEPIPIGQFTVRFLSSGHVPQNPLVDMATGIGKTINDPLVPPAWVSRWKEGESWAVLVEHERGTILLQGSAGFREGQLQGYQADLALVSSVGLFRQPNTFQASYFRNTVLASGAHTVVPIHWDDFFTELRGPDTPPLPWLVEHLNGSFRTLAGPAARAGTRFLLLSPGETLWLPARQAEARQSGAN